MAVLLLLILLWLLVPVLPVSLAIIITAVAVNRLRASSFLAIAFFAGIIESIWLVLPFGLWSIALLVYSMVIFAIQWRFAFRPLWLTVLMAVVAEAMRQYYYQATIHWLLLCLTAFLTILFWLITRINHREQAVYLKP